jgi:hypothetical protein
MQSFLGEGLDYIFLYAWINSYVYVSSLLKDVDKTLHMAFTL